MSEQEQAGQESLKQQEVEARSSEKANDDIDTVKLRKPERQMESKSKKKRKLLSFQDEEQEQQLEVAPRKRKSLHIKKEQGGKDSGKWDDIEERLKLEYFAEMERIREEFIQFQFSYWDGPNVVKKIRRKKNTRVIDYLEVFRQDLIQNFQNIALVETKDLLLVIKDFIAPHEITLGEVELLKLKTTKNDLLLNLRSVKMKKEGRDLTLSVNLDGPVRIIEKARFQKNKANYPFCNWHTLDLAEK